MNAGSTFTAAMIQMRTGLLPEPSLAQGIKLIREAAAGGADYVLTPEVSNMMQLNRKALFEQLADEEHARSLAAYRDLARALKIHVHGGSGRNPRKQARHLRAFADHRSLGRRNRRRGHRARRVHGHDRSGQGRGRPQVDPFVATWPAFQLRRPSGCGSSAPRTRIGMI